MRTVSKGVWFEKKVEQPLYSLYYFLNGSSAFDIDGRRKVNHYNAFYMVPPDVQHAGEHVPITQVMNGAHDDKSGYDGVEFLNVLFAGAETDPNSPPESTVIPQVEEVTPEPLEEHGGVNLTHRILLTKGHIDGVDLVAEAIFPPNEGYTKHHNWEGIQHEFYFVVEGGGKFGREHVPADGDPQFLLFDVKPRDLVHIPPKSKFSLHAGADGMRLLYIIVKKPNTQCLPEYPHASQPYFEGTARRVHASTSPGYEQMLSRRVFYHGKVMDNAIFDGFAGIGPLAAQAKKQQRLATPGLHPLDDGPKTSIYPTEVNGVKLQPAVFEFETVDNMWVKGKNHSELGHWR